MPHLLSNSVIPSKVNIFPLLLLIINRLVICWELDFVSNSYLIAPKSPESGSSAATWNMLAPATTESDMVRRYWSLKDPSSNKNLSKIKEKKLKVLCRVLHIKNSNWLKPKGRDFLVFTHLGALSLTSTILIFTIAFDFWGSTNAERVRRPTDTCISEGIKIR